MYTIGEPSARAKRQPNTDVKISGARFIFDNSFSRGRTVPKKKKNTQDVNLLWVEPKLKDGCIELGLAVGGVETAFRLDIAEAHLGHELADVLALAVEHQEELERTDEMMVEVIADMKKVRKTKR